MLKEKGANKRNYKHTWVVFSRAYCDAHEYCEQDQLLLSSLQHFVQFVLLSKMALEFQKVVWRKDMKSLIWALILSHRNYMTHRWSAVPVPLLEGNCNSECFPLIHWKLSVNFDKELQWRTVWMEPLLCTKLKAPKNHQHVNKSREDFLKRVIINRRISK